MPIDGARPFVWQPPQDAAAASRESCTMQAIISGGVGGLAGMVLGAVLAPFQSNMASIEDTNLPMKEQFRRGFKEMGTQGKAGVFSPSQLFAQVWQ